MSDKVEEVFCTFCGLGSAHKTMDKVIRAPSGEAYICNNCVVVCLEILIKGRKAEVFDSPPMEDK
jgi:hypothetical protein